MGLAWLGETLTANGYIVAAVNHHGNTGAEPTQPLQGTLVWWDRPQDLSVLIDRLLADPKLGPRIDASRIGVAGSSIGGYTALASLGARLSRSQWQKFCADAATAPSCKLPPEIISKFPDGEAQRLLTQDPRMLSAVAHMDDAYRDPRIKAAFVMAPVMGAAMTHDSFLATCNDKGNTYAKEICTSPASVERESPLRSCAKFPEVRLLSGGQLTKHNSLCDANGPPDG